MRWAEYNKYRKEVSPWLDFRKVPLTTKTSLELALELIPDNAKILDIGASNRRFEKELKNRKKKVSTDPWMLIRVISTIIITYKRAIQDLILLLCLQLWSI